MNNYSSKWKEIGGFYEIEERREKSQTRLEPSTDTYRKDKVTFL